MKIAFQFRTDNIELVNFIKNFDNVSEELEKIIDDFRTKKLIYQVDADLIKRQEIAKVETTEVKLQILKMQLTFMQTFGSNPKGKHQKLFETRAFSEQEESEILKHFHIEFSNSMMNKVQIQCASCYFNTFVNDIEKLEVCSKHLSSNHKELINQ